MKTSCKYLYPSRELREIIDDSSMLSAKFFDNQCRSDDSLKNHRWFSDNFNAVINDHWCYWLESLKLWCNIDDSVIISMHPAFFRNLQKFEKRPDYRNSGHYPRWGWDLKISYFEIWALNTLEKWLSRSKLYEQKMLQLVLGKLTWLLILGS